VITPVEVVTRTGKLRHAAYVSPESKGHVHVVPPYLGVCGRAKSATSLLRTDWLAACGHPVARWPVCKACWKQVALDEGVTA
jgi:hypothetical protein